MLKSAGDDPGGVLLTALRSGFPALRAVPPREIAAFLPHITEVVRRVQAGLDAQAAQIALAGEGAAAPPSAMGRVGARAARPARPGNPRGPGATRPAPGAPVRGRGRN
ncbi:hypothetical protein ABZ667_25385 [Streptomyces lavendulae]|uniref:hypothetical protein n=1 Tax=Streptomyces lavendulae TaxID=1914 RepID=UPI0033E8C2F9